MPDGAPWDPVRAPDMSHLAGDLVSYVGVVTVNWNGWADTLECLEALFRMTHFSGPVIVIDNGSRDGSVELIRAWAAGTVSVLPQSNKSEIVRLVTPPISKPVSVQFIDQTDDMPSPGLDTDCRLFIVRLADNLGFAAGNNVGIRVLLRFPKVEFIWLINNDALPREDALTEFVATCGSINGPFLAGATVLEYWFPESIQALGGRYFRYFGIGSHAMAGQDASSVPTNVPRLSVDYPMGAAMFVNRAFIRVYGFMSEDYFLYYEEIDWVLRMGWPSKAFLVPRSIVFHKGGRATKAGRGSHERSLSADYYMLRNRILLARKISIVALITVMCSTPILILRRSFRKPAGVFLNAVVAVLDGIRGQKGKRKSEVH